MKILYISKIHTNAKWGFECFLNNAFQELKVDTICVDYQQNSYVLARKLLEIKEDFDALLLERGCGYLIPLSLLQAIQRPRFLLFTELVERNPKQHYLLKSGLFEHIFFRSTPCMTWIKRQNWLRDDQMSLLMSAAEPRFHRFIPGIKKDIDVLFIGNLLPRRQFLIKDLSQYFPITVCTVFGEDMIHLMNRAKIILNLHGSNLPDTETRVYEALACKGFLITETLSSESPFQNGVHLIEASSLTDLRSKIIYYLAHPEERQKIASSGYNEVVKNHTVLNRARYIKTIIDHYLSELKKKASYKNDYAFDYSCLNYIRFLEALGRRSQQVRLGFQRISSFTMRIISSNKRENV